MRSLWAGAMLLRRLGAERGVILLIFVLVAGTSFVFAAAPRLFNRVTDDALQYAVRVASPQQRSISASLSGNIGARAGDGVAPIRERGQQIEAKFSPAITDLIADRPLRFTSVRMYVWDPPSYDTRLYLRYRDGLTDRTKLAAGRWPEDHGATLKTIAVQTGENEPPAPATGPPDVFEAAISTATATEVGLKLGDRIEIRLDGSDPAIQGAPLTLAPSEVEIVGLYDPLDEADPYWFADDDMLHAVQRGNPDQPIAWITAYVPPEMYPNLAGSRLPFQYEWRYATAPERYESDEVPQLQSDLRRLGVNAGVAAGASGTVDIRTGLPGILEDFAAERALTETVLSIATLGPFGLAAGAIAMVALLLVRRRRGTLALARGRGASASLLLGTQLWEGILVTGAATVVGLGVATVLIPARSSPLSAELAIAVGALATLLLLGASWSTARRPLGNLERDDAPLRGVSTRRLVVEGTIVFLAAAAMLLLRDRGLAAPAPATGVGTPTATPTASVNPLLAAVPLLAGLAAGIVALRLYPFPIRALGWLAARRRDFVPVLGLRTIGRHPGAANLPLLVLLLTAAFGAFASTLSSSIDRGQVTASYLDVGSDFRIERIGLGSMPELAQVTAVPGVEAVARGIVDPLASFQSTAGQRASIEVAAIETAEYAAVVAGTPAEPHLPGAFVVTPPANPGTAEDPIPAILSTKVPAGSKHLDLGDTFRVTVNGQPLVLRLVERRDIFPGIDQRSAFTIAPLPWVQAAFDHPRGTGTMWVRASTDIRPGLAAAIADAGAAARIVSRFDTLAALRDAPLEAVITTGYLAALVIAAVYMALAIVGAMVLSAAGRTRDLAYLRTLGVTGRQAFGLTVMEHGPPVIIALIPGLALGIAIVLLVEPGLGLATFVGSTGVPLYIDWLPLAALAVALIAVVATAVGLGTWLARRARPTDALRIGET